MTEHEIQSRFIDWVSLKHPTKLVYAVPNGGHRHPRVAAKLKREGVLKGVPDLIIDEPSGIYHGLRIELKKQGGRVSIPQKHVMDMMSSRGYAVYVCYSLEDAIEKFENYIKGQESVLKKY